MEEATTGPVEGHVRVDYGPLGGMGSSLQVLRWSSADRFGIMAPSKSLQTGSTGVLGLQDPFHRPNFQDLQASNCQFAPVKPGDFRLCRLGEISDQWQLRRLRLE